MHDLLDDQLLADLAVRLDFLSEEEVRACRDVQRMSPTPRPLSQVMLELQYLTLGQLQRLREEGGRSSSRDGGTAPSGSTGLSAGEPAVSEAEPSRTVEGMPDAFGRLVIQKGFATPHQVAECLMEQRAQEKQGLPMKLGQILFQRRYINTAQFLEILREQGQLPADSPAAPLEAKSKVRDETTIDTIQLAPASSDPRKVSRFRLLRPVGRSRHYSSYEAVDDLSQRKVLVKSINRMSDEAVSRRFLREARRIAEIEPPGVARIVQAGIHEGISFFACEWIEGGSLERMVAERSISYNRGAEIIERVARVLEGAHAEGFVHGNLKPSNILLDRKGTPFLTDFGTAGSPHGGTAPEIARAGADLEPSEVRGDVYSLGALLYGVLGGRVPSFPEDEGEARRAIAEWRPTRLREHRPDVPRDLETICLKALDRDPALRYPTAGEMADDLRRFLNGESIRARPVSTVRRMTHHVRRRKGLVAACLVGLLTAGFGGYLFLRWQARNDADAAAELRRDRRRKAYPFYLRAEEQFREAERGLAEETGALQTVVQEAGRAAILLSEAVEILRKAGPEEALLKALDSARTLSGGGAAVKETLQEALRRLGTNPDPAVKDLFERARRACERALREHGAVRFWPGDLDARYEKAVRELDLAISRDPDYPQALHLRGRIHLRLWRLDEAEADLARAETLYREERAEDPGALRRDAAFHRACLLLAQYELWRGRPLVLLSESGESLSFSETETARAAAVRKELIRAMTPLVGEGDQDTFSGLLARAALALAGGDSPTSAPAFLDPISSEEASDPLLFRVRGTASYARKKYRWAFEDFHRLLRASPLLASGSRTEWGLYPPRALAWILREHDRALNKQPSAVLHINRGVIRRALGQYREAKEDFAAAVRLRPEDPEALLHEAEFSLFLARRLPPDGVADAASLRREEDRTLETLDRILRLAKNDPRALRLRALLHLSQGRWKKAAADAREAVRLRPEDPTYLYVVGMADFHRGEPDRALRNASRAISMIPSYGAAHHLGAAARLQIPDVLGAADDIERALLLRPRDPRIYLTRARVRSVSTPLDAAGAKRDLQKAASLDPRLSEIWFWRGEFLGEGITGGMRKEEVASRLRESLKSYEKALDVDKENCHAEIMRAYRRLQLRRSKDQTELKEAFARAPECGWGFLLRGEMHFRAGRFDLARREWEAARERIPNRRLFLDDAIGRARRGEEEARKIPEWMKHAQHGQRFVNDRKYDRAKEEYGKAAKTLPDEAPGDQRHLQWLVLFAYNYACVLSVEAKALTGEARKKKGDEAFDWLGLACRFGYLHWRDSCHGVGREHMRFDEDFAAIRDDDRFKRLLGYTEE